MNGQELGAQAAEAGEECKFDEYKIVEHYVRLREWQHERLANSNLSEELKRKLFGFSEGYYLTNTHDPYRLLIENHPLRGRTLMTEDRHNIRLQNQRRDRSIVHSRSRSSSEDKNFSDPPSDIELSLPFERKEPDEQRNSQSAAPLQPAG